MSASFPELLEHWPVEGDLVIPLDQLPDNLRRSMGDAWGKREENRRILRERNQR